MKIDANDPKWTAYALGEITDEKERAEIEKALEESTEIRQLVEGIRETAGLLKAELNAEQPIYLTQEQRKRIEEKSHRERSWFGLRPAWAVACTAAAVLLISFVAVRQLLQVQKSPSEDPIALVIPRERNSVTLQKSESPSTPAASHPSTYASAVETKKEADVMTPPAPEKMKAADMAVEAARSSAKPELAEPAVIATAAAVSQLEGQKAVLMGTVKDPSGAVIPGVAVKVTDEATGITAQAVTNAAGQYSFPALAPGLHSLTANLPGFQNATYKDIALNAASPTKLDVNLQIKSVSSAIEVTVATDSLTMASGSGAAMGGGVSQGFSASSVKQLSRVKQDRLDSVSVVGGVSGNEMRYRRRPIPIPPPPPRDIRPPWQRPRDAFNTEAYDNISDNSFLDVTQNPLSTFSIDVDTASYSNVRRFLDGGSLPPKDAVRIEELVNYFDYDYKGPKNDKPFAVNFEITEAPWKPEHRLLRIGLKGREIPSSKRPNCNLVFLIDVSGSMVDQNKLPLVKESLIQLVDQLIESDRVAIVVYASDTSVFMPSTSGDQKERLRRAIDRLQAGGSTNGASGIQLAYQTAKESFIQGGVNRVILATDGDFNVGITNRGDLTRLIEEKAKSGIFLSALGFGMGNYKDSTLELLADKGRGNYAYIDNLKEAKKVLVEQFNATLVTIAKDVKIQVEFNPQQVSAYRLIGYEDRLMAKEDFNDDTKQAGVVGSGHAVTALYELIPVGISDSKSGVDPLKYQKPAQPSSAAISDEWLTVKIRSKEPEKNTSVLSEFAVKESKAKFSNASADFKFAAAVAAFGMALRDSPYRGSANLERALEWAKEGKGDDIHGYRQEFIRLIHRAISISD